VTGPYRDPPRNLPPVRCEICGLSSEFVRCTGCLAVEALLPSLEFPVVVVDFRWLLGPLKAGAAFFLVDRWSKIARCGCQFPFSPGQSLSAIARARAGLWAPGAVIAVGPTEHDNAFAESLVRTRTVDHPAVQHRFESAVVRAIREAGEAHEGQLLGTWIWPESER
jgi:hypothetical protein